MKRVLIYRIDSGELMEEYLFIKSDIPQHEFKKLILFNLGQIESICEILKEKGYSSEWIGNQDTMNINAIETDCVMDLFDFRMLEERKELLYGLEYALYDNGHILDISASVNGYRYKIYDTALNKMTSDVYEDDRVTIFEAAEEIMFEYEMNIDTSVRLWYTNFKKLVNLKKSAYYILREHCKDSFVDSSFSFVDGQVILPVHKEGFESCETLTFQILYDGDSNDSEVLRLLHEENVDVSDMKCDFDVSHVINFESLEALIQKNILINDYHKPRVIYKITEPEGIKVECEPQLERAIKVFENDDDMSELILIESFSDRNGREKYLIKNSKYNEKMNIENLVERQNLHRVRLELFE